MKNPHIRNAKAFWSLTATWACTVVCSLCCFRFCTFSIQASEEILGFEDAHAVAVPFDSNSSYACVPGVLSTECVDYEASKLARAFPYRHRSTWCLPSGVLPVQKNFILRQGLILTKVPKAASSTSAGVALRITDRNRCHPAQWEHRPGRHYGRRIRDRSFLFTTVRMPADRAISSIFFHKVSVSRRIRESRTSDRRILRELRGRGQPSFHTGTVSTGQAGFTLQYASLVHIPEHSAWKADEPKVVQSPATVLDHVRRLVEDYDMLLVVDRMDESLVALSLVLGVDVGDVVVADSKVTGETYRLLADKPLEDSVCVPTVKSFKSPAVTAFLKSEHWLASNYGDWVLYTAANKSLDLTIEMIGREKFEAVLAEYRRLKALVDERCADQIYLPCGPTGKLQLKENEASCYLKGRDFGCAHACIDGLFDGMGPPFGRNYSYISLESNDDPQMTKALLYDKS